MYGFISILSMKKIKFSEYNGHMAKIVKLLPQELTKNKNVDIVTSNCVNNIIQVAAFDKIK